MTVKSPSTVSGHRGQQWDHGRIWLAEPPVDEYALAVLGDPLLNALNATGRYWGQDLPFGITALTVDAYDGFLTREDRVDLERTFGEAMNPPSSGAGVEKLRIQVSKARGEMRAVNTAALLAFQAKAEGLDFAQGLQEQYTKEIAAADEWVSMPARIQRYTNLDGQSAVAIRRRQYAQWMAAAQILNRVLDNHTETWHTMGRLAGRIPGPEATSRVFRAHWREVRRALLFAVRSRQDHNNHPVRLSRLLYPQETAHIDTLGSLRAASLATWLTWERAGRPGKISTFAKQIGVDFSPGKLGSDRDLLEAPLTERYTAPQAAKDFVKSRCLTREGRR